ncbi:MAG TPA: aminotransferase class IV [Solirubrobacteraceae bacterium]|nr:aminotransferase class IV [Solirubrobacteraceae bacterium]
MLMASVDGVVTPVEEARIPVTDEGLLRGDGGFEVVRVYGGQPFAWRDHLDRLARTCDGLRLQADLEALDAEALALLAEAGEQEVLLRLVVTRGGRRIALVERLPDRPDAARVMTVTYAPTRVLNGLKTLSYGANMLAGRLAKEAGFDEALLVTPHGRVLEGPTWTFFWAAGDVLRTPPLADGILDSITRRRLLDELAVREEPCTLDDVAAAEEAFIASSVREVMPIAVVDEIELPAAPGPITRAAHDAFTQRVVRELAAERTAA